MADATAADVEVLEFFVRDSGVGDVGSLFLMAISAHFDGGLFGCSFFGGFLGGLFNGALVESCGGHCGDFSSLGGVGGGGRL